MTDRLRQSLEPFITPLFRTWWRYSRGMTLGVRGVAIDEDQRVLLVRHTYKAGWHLPGGGVEKGENAVEALKREMAEEGGIAIHGAPALLGFYSNHAIFRNDHVAVYQVAADVWTPCPPNSLHEIAERGFFERTALPESATPGTRRRIAEAFGEAAPQANW